MFTIDGIDFEYTRGKFYKKIKVMPEGAAFGEIALYERCVRTATIKTIDHSIELAWLSKAHFDQELRAIEETALDNKIKFLRSIHSWRNLRREQVARFVSYCRE